MKGARRRRANLSAEFFPSDEFDLVELGLAGAPGGRTEGGTTAVPTVPSLDAA